MELRKQRTNLIVALVILGVAVVLWVYVIPTQIRLNALWGGSSKVTSRTFPYFSAATIGLAALGELALSGYRYWRLKQQNAILEKKSINWKSEMRAVLIFLLCVGYGILFSRVGYLVATLVVPPMMLFVLGNRNWKHYLAVYGVGILTYVVFLYLLYIPLP